MALFNDFRRGFLTTRTLFGAKFRTAVAALALVACDTGDQARSYDFSQTSLGLHAFDDCDELSAYFKAEALALLDEFGAYDPALHGFVEEDSAAPPADRGGAGGEANFSRTNTQEADVDEPDLVKTDGRWIYLTRHGQLLIYTADSLELLSERPAPGYDARLMLHGDKVIVLGTQWGGALGEGVTTTALVYDVTDRAAPREVRRVEVEGRLAAARAAKGTARLAIQYDASEKLAGQIDYGYGAPGDAPVAIDVEAPMRDEPKADDGRDWREAARELIGKSQAEDWLPQLADSALDGNRPAVACGAMFRPGERAGLSVTALVSIDLDDPGATMQHTGVVSGAGVVYASADNLYLSTMGRFDMVGVPRGDVAIAEPAAPGMAVVEQPLVADRQATQIHRLSIEDADRAPRYAGSGRVHGALLNQFSMSEHEGHLRVATTEQSMDGEFLTNNVTVLGLEEMKVTGTIEGIAKTERIYATRFMGDRGFVVTFRQVDPLFTLDLKDPENPQLVGELKVPGFSTYLHPLGADHLIGIGRSATAEGVDTGMQLSLFDVRKFSAPRLAHDHHFGQAWSDAQYDHHAFTWWGDRSLLFVPIESWEDDARRTGVEAFKVTVDGGFVPAGFIAHDDWSGVQRSVVIDDVVYTISQEGMQATGLNGMDDQGGVVFPRP